jgi:hypothetical protein
MNTPVLLPEMRLRAAAVVPPTVLLTPVLMNTPEVLARAVVPVGSVPI